MSDFKFHCPECGQKISCDSTMIGTQISCPTCQKSLTVPIAVPAAAAPQPVAASAAVAAAPIAWPAAPPVPKSKPANTSRYSALAIASLISSVFVFFGFIPGIICGHMAKARMRKDVFLEGEKMANAGLVISYCMLALALVGAGMVFSVYWQLHPRRTVLASFDAPDAPQSRVVDEVIAGQNEDDHGLENPINRSSSTGKPGRSTERGGSFGYTMKVLPNAPMDLLCRYWGSEPRGRFFDIAVDGQIIATEKFDHPLPDKFYDLEYKIPDALTRGKEEVSVLFQARPTWSAGTIYRCETVRR
jgi:hypothetical protein